MATREPKGWITVNGVHVPIFEGETKADAAKNYLSKRKSAPAKKTGQKQSRDDLGNAEDRTERIATYRRQLEDVQEDIEQFESTSPRLRAPDYDEKLSALKKKEQELKGYIERDSKPWKDKKTGKQTESQKVISKNEDLKEKQIAENKKQAKEAAGKKDISQMSRDELRARRDDESSHPTERYQAAMEIRKRQRERYLELHPEDKKRKAAGKK